MKKLSFSQLVERFEAAPLGTKVPSETQWFYHVTNSENAQDILRSGFVDVHEPWHGTDQDAWPDGSTEDRSYWSANANAVWSFAPYEGEAVILRVPRDAGEFAKEKYTGDIITNKPVDVRNGQLYGRDERWHDLSDAFTEASGASAPSDAARQSPGALPDAVTSGGMEGVPTDPFDDEVRPEDMQTMDWNDLLDEDSTEQMVTLLHVTNSMNVSSIMKHGLQPQIGTRSQEANEFVPRVYAFPDENTMEDAITNGDIFDDDEPLSVLKVTVPQSWISQDEVEWEITIQQHVPPDMIKMHIPNIDDYITEDAQLPSVNAADFKAIEAYADRLFAKVGIDVDFTRHFRERVNDSRNQNRPITAAELTRLFKQTFKKHGKVIPKLPEDSRALLKDMSTDLNVPFILVHDPRDGSMHLVSKTIIRNRDYRAGDEIFAVEDIWGGVSHQSAHTMPLDKLLSSLSDADKRFMGQLEAEPSEQGYLKNLETSVSTGMKTPVRLIILPDGKLHVPDGNHRMIVAKRLGLKEVPYVIDKDLSDTVTEVDHPEFMPGGDETRGYSGHDSTYDERDTQYNTGHPAP